MTVSSAVAKSGPYTGADDFVFAYNFRVFADAEIQVTTVVITTGVEEILTLTTDYTVQDAGDPTGTITLTAGTFPTGLPSTKKLVVSRDMGFLQEIDFENQGGFFPDTHEDGLDRLKMEVQQVKEEVDRSVKVDITGTTTPDDLLTEIDVSVSAASASAAAAAASEAATAADVVLTAASVVAAADEVSYAEEWATKAEDSLISVEAGGDGVGDYSALHWAAKAAATDAYTKVQLDAGQLDNRYYTETELDAGQLDNRYYTETENDATFQKKAESSWTYGGKVATTSGSSADFTGLPDWIKEIRLVLDSVSASGTNSIKCRIGDSGGFASTGYAGAESRLQSATIATSNITDGASVFVNNAANSVSGIWTIMRSEDDDAIWVFAFTGAYIASATTLNSGSRKTLSGTLDRIQLVLTANSFDNGSVSLYYR